MPGLYPPNFKCSDWYASKGCSVQSASKLWGLVSRYAVGISGACTACTVSSSPSLYLHKPCKLASESMYGSVTRLGSVTSLIVCNFLCVWCLWTGGQWLPSTSMQQYKLEQHKCLKHVTVHSMRKLMLQEVVQLKPDHLYWWLQPCMQV